MSFGYVSFGVLSFGVRSFGVMSFRIMSVYRVFEFLKFFVLPLSALGYQQVDRESQGERMKQKIEDFKKSQN